MGQLIKGVMEKFSGVFSRGQSNPQSEYLPVATGPTSGGFYGPGRAKYKFGEMSVGCSRFYPGGSTAIPPGRNAASAANLYGKYHGKKFTARTVTENGEQGVRIWRVE